jgi:hypothetical protein
MDTFDDRGGRFNHTNAALSGLSGAASTYSTTGTQTYSIDGRIYTTAAKSGVATPTLDKTTGAAFKILPNLKQCIFVFGWDSAGDLAVSQGPIVTTTEVDDKSAALHFPSIPDTMVPFAYVSIRHANATGWTFGTSNWNATGVTIDTVINVSLLPTQPRTVDTV